MKMDKLEKLETISKEIIEICIKNGLSISEMNDLAMFFPKLMRKEIAILEERTLFKVNSVL